MGFIFENEANEIDKKYLLSLNLKSGFSTEIELNSNRIRGIAKDVERNLILITTGTIQEFGDPITYMSFYLVYEGKAIRFMAAINDKHIGVEDIKIPQSLEESLIDISDILRESMICWFIYDKSKINEYTIKINPLQYIPADRWKHGGL